LSGWKDRIGQPEHNLRFTILGLLFDRSKVFPWLQFDALVLAHEFCVIGFGDGMALV
jgi:hypothetical protein